MKRLWLPLVVLAVIAVLAFWLAWTNKIVSAAPAFLADVTLHNQVLPTETPQTESSEEVLMTNPALLQAIILLGIVAVLVIFVGVWINRRKVALR
jgi:hypothetical protein